MLPKFPESVLVMYFVVLINVFLPSINQLNIASMLFLVNIISAASLAISTALSTEIPTSAYLMAGASLLPSPKKPTTLPFFSKH